MIEREGREHWVLYLVGMVGKREDVRSPLFGWFTWWGQSSGELGRVLLLSISNNDSIS